MRGAEISGAVERPPRFEFPKSSLAASDQGGPQRTVTKPQPALSQVAESGPGRVRLRQPRRELSQPSHKTDLAGSALARKLPAAKELRLRPVGTAFATAVSREGHSHDPVCSRPARRSPQS